MYSIGSITEEDESIEESQASLKLEDTATLLQSFEKSVNNAIEAFKGKNGIWKPHYFHQNNFNGIPFLKLTSNK